MRSWNSFEYFDKSVHSVLNQTYQNFKILYVDDASDYSRSEINYIKERLKKHECVFRKDRLYSVFNAYDMLHKYVRRRNSVVVVVDADDWLVDKGALSYLAQEYSGHELKFTYGSCVIWNGYEYINKSEDDKYLLLNTRYKKSSIKNGNFLREPFRVFHPMTFRFDSFNSIPKTNFMENSTKWFRYCFDLCTYLPLIKMYGDNYKYINRKLYAYNTHSSNTNIKVNPYNFVREDLFIRSKNIYG